MNNKSPRGLFVGHTTHDRFGDATVAGGSAWFGAQTWRGLGGDAHLVTVVGADFHVEDAFAGLAAEVHRAGRTTVFHNRYEGTGPRVQWIEATAPPVLPPPAPPTLRSPTRPEGPADAVFLAPVFGEVDLAAWKSATGAKLVAIGVQGWIKAAGARIAVDHETENDRAAGTHGAGNGREGARRVVPLVWAPSPAALAGVDVAVLSDDDLRGQTDLLERLLAGVPLVALTHGRDGATVFAGGERTTIAAFPTKEVDPTGAGDTFAAGFLYGLAAGRPPVEAARLGAAAASIIVEATGGAALERMPEAFERAKEVAIRG